MSKQYLFNIASGTLIAGPVDFDIFTPHKSGKMILFCKAGGEISSTHLDILKDSTRMFYIRSLDKNLYVDYTSSRLESIISDRHIRVTDKANILHQVGKRFVKKMLDDPKYEGVVKESAEIVDHYVDMVLQSPDAANELFALSSYDSYTYSHSVNVSTLNLLIADKYYNGDKEKLWELGMAGLMHDVGKTQVDQAVLFKAGKLTDEEFKEVKRHAEFSYEILKGHNYSDAICQAGRNHHERWIGGGYPDNLKGPEIHIFARITAVADVYDALTSKRVYKEEKHHMDSLKIMVNSTGHFDPDIFSILLDIVLQNDKLINEFKEAHFKTHAPTGDNWKAALLKAKKPGVI